MSKNWLKYAWGPSPKGVDGRVVIWKGYRKESIQSENENSTYKFREMGPLLLYPMEMALAVAPLAEAPGRASRGRKRKRRLHKSGVRTSSANPATIHVQADIGDRLAAIKFLADSQGPGRSFLELIENSIDEYPEGFQTYRVIRIKTVRRGPRSYLRIEDFGRGFVPDRHGVPDFPGVVTRVASSMKKYLADYRGAQGEFAVGLFGFRTLGREITIVSRSAYEGYPNLSAAYGLPGRGLSPAWEMTMSGTSLSAIIRPTAKGRSTPGTTITIRGLHNPRLWTCQKIKRAIEEEMWSRLLERKLTVSIEDNGRTMEVKPEPRTYSGTHFPQTSSDTEGFGPVLFDLYVTPGEEGSAEVAVLRARSREAGATKVYDALTEIDDFRCPPWNLQRVKGWVRFDGARISGPARREFAHDEAFHAFVRTMKAIGPRLLSMIAAQDVERQRVEVEALRERLKADLLRVVSDLPYLDFFKLTRDSVNSGIPAPRKHPHPSRRSRRPAVHGEARMIRAPGPPGGAKPYLGLPTPEFVTSTTGGWHSHYDILRHVVTINKSHPDYVRESINRRRWYRYILKLYTKELVLLSFPTTREGPKLLETAIQAELRAEENL